jgi:hypothetical protein
MTNQMVARLVHDVINLLAAKLSTAQKNTAVKAGLFTSANFKSNQLMGAVS